ncbi:MAG: peptidoglycan-binding protein [Pseudanabaena sp.]|jgi:hypothetical protein
MTRLNDPSVIKACDTGLLVGLNRQIIAVINSIVPNTLVNISDIAGVKSEGNQINPFLQAAAKESLRVAVNERRAAEGNDVVLEINSAYRTVAQQYLLNLQKNAGRCGITATAPPGFSNHEGGLALDIQDADGWRPYFERHSWFWIGSFDPVHFDYKFFAATRSDLGTLGIKAFQRLWNAHNPNDILDDDGDFGPQTEARLAQSPIAGFGVTVLRTLGLTTPPLTGDDVKKLQGALINNKITKISIPITGIFDQTTKDALIQFQAATKRLAVDGLAGSSTYEALGI